MSIFPRECCFHEDPTCVYDCISWDQNTRLYALKNDAGRRVECEYHCFTPISELGEALLEYTKDGRLIKVDGDFLSDSLLCSSSHARRPMRPDLPTQGQAAKEGQAKAAPGHASTQGEVAEARAKAKETVSKLFEGVSDREFLAAAASSYLGERTQTLLEKYEHLDNGRFRMTLGNRVRGALTKQILEKGK